LLDLFQCFLPAIYEARSSATGFSPASPSSPLQRLHSFIRAAINAEHVAAYRKQAANASVSSPILVGLRAPILVSFLRTTVGSGAGEASAQVIDALAKAFGAQPIPEAVKAAIEADPNAAANVDPVDASDNQSQ
jgi:hypothetical protein